MNKSSSISVNWYLLSKYRKELFGLSIISIMIFHFFEDIQNSDTTGAVVRIASLYNSFIGSIGVEIFIFLSGVGLYFSLNKNDSVLKFYRKRIKRVIIPYLLYGALFWIVKDIVILHESIFSFMFDYTLVSFWINGNRNLWYIALIIILYLICPLLYRLLKGDNKFRTLNAFILVILPIVLINLCSMISQNIYDNIEIAFYRVPVFVLGLYYGDKVLKKKKIDVLDTTMMTFCFILRGARVVGGVGDMIPPRLSVGFFSLPISFILVYLLKIIHFKKLDSFLALAGTYSLELYLTHVTVRTIMNLSGLPTYRICNYIICIIISVILSFLFCRITELIVNNTKQKI